MITDIILIALAIIILFISSIFDIKTKEVPDNLSIGLIITALTVRLIHAIATSDWFYFLYGLLGFGIMFIIGLILYHTKQWGGADSKILMGLGATFATPPFFYTSEIPFLLLLFIMIIMVGGLYGFLFGILTFYKNKKQAIKLFKEKIQNNKKVRKIFILFAILLLVSSLFFSILQVKTLLIILALFLISYFYLSIFTKTIEQIGFIKKLPISKVTEGDWLAKDVKLKNKLLVSKRQPCLTQKDLNKIKKHKIRKIWVKIGIPFLPAMTIATIITLLLPMVF